MQTDALQLLAGSRLQHRYVPEHSLSFYASVNYCERSKLHSQVGASTARS